MNKSFSGKGKAWEWKHSIWILWTLPIYGWTSFISFLYIGKRTKTTKWIVFGIIYLAWTLFHLIVLPAIPLNLTGVTYEMGLLIWVWSIVHAFLVRKEYLTRLSYLADHPEIREKSTKKYYNAVTNDYQKASAPNKRVITMPAKETEPKNNNTENSVDYTVKNTAEKTALVIDINKGSVDELVTLPGITMPIAKKIIDRRNDAGDFTSIDEFMDFVMVKPHFAVKLREVVTVSESTGKKQTAEQKRNIDF